MVYSPQRMKALFYGLSFPYRFGSQIKNWLYDRKILIPKKAPLPIISIGNIIFGGSEKTPLVMEVLSFLIDKGYRPAMITRGYRGRWEKRGGILSDGTRMQGGWMESGDEPFMVARNIPQAGVFIGKNRLASCQKASTLGFDVGILDDGFQHRSLHRDLDIVLYDPEAEFLLREPLSSLKRAHILLVKGKSLRKRGISFSQKPIFTYSVYSRGFYLLDDAEQTIDSNHLKRKKVVAFCGIARPERFLSLLQSEGIIPVCFLKFPDHHDYPPSSVEKIRWTCRERGADAVVMTEKDAVKMRSYFSPKKLPAYYLKIGIKLEEKFFQEFLSWLKGKERRF